MEYAAVWKIFISSGAFRGLPVGTFPYALHMKRSGCQTHVSLACVEDEDVRTVVLGSVVVESGWEEHVAGLVAGCHSCVPAVKDPEVLVVEEVGNLSAALAGYFKCATHFRGRDTGKSRLASKSRPGCQLQELLWSGSIRCGGLSAVEDGVSAHCQSDGKVFRVECGKSNAESFNVGQIVKANSCEIAKRQSAARVDV